jgi:hypothetical protein
VACLPHECEFGYVNFPRKQQAGLLLRFGHLTYDSSDVPFCCSSDAKGKTIWYRSLVGEISEQLRSERSTYDA